MTDDIGIQRRDDLIAELRKHIETRDMVIAGLNRLVTDLNSALAAAYEDAAHQPHPPPPPLPPPRRPAPLESDPMTRLSQAAIDAGADTLADALRLSDIEEATAVARVVLKAAAPHIAAAERERILDVVRVAAGSSVATIVRNALTEGDTT